MNDLRLDWMNNISPEFCEKMKKTRELFIELDSAIQEFGDENNYLDSGAARTLAIARTHLESSCMYTIKSLCLLGEIK